MSFSPGQLQKTERHYFQTNSLPTIDHGKLFICEGQKSSMNTQAKIFSSLDSLLQTISERQRKLVVVGGCFDILHTGHVMFLEEAKKQGETLIVLLESDESIKRRKGNTRPINMQHDRAYILASLTSVDFVFLLPNSMHDSDYERLVITLKPAIIAITAQDKYRVHKERQAALISAKVVKVVDPIQNKSTSQVLRLLQETNE